MTDSDASGRYSQNRPARYRILVCGKIEIDWSDRAEGMTISLDEGPDGTQEITLVGSLRDQATLLGLLRALWEQNLSLISLARLSEGSGRT
jgi:hypothetical protein